MRIKTSQLISRILVFLSLFLAWPQFIWAEQPKLKNFSSEKIRLLRNTEFKVELLNKINSAQKSIYLSQYLFKLSRHPNNPARLILNSLVAAKNRGVKVKVILEYSDFNKPLNRNNYYTLKLLKKNGISSRSDSAKIQNHGKLAIIDGRWTFIGSHNLSYSALSKNYELSVLIDSKKIAAEALDYFNDIK